MADAEVHTTSDVCSAERHPSSSKDSVTRPRCTSCNTIKKNPVKLRSSDRVRKSQPKVASGVNNKTPQSFQHAHANLASGKAKMTADLRCAEALVENVATLDIKSMPLIVENCDQGNQDGSKVMDCNTHSDKGQIPSTCTQDADKVQSTTTYTLIENGEISTSDYDSCFETDVDTEGSSDHRQTVTGSCGVCGGGGVRDGDDADSGVVENGCGVVPIGNDFVDLKEVLVESLEQEEAGRNEIEEARIMEMIESLDEKVDRKSLVTEAEELLRLIPNGYIPLPHQVGGHRHVDGKLGFIRKLGQTDILYKPVQYGIKGPREVQFYESLFKTENKHLSDDMQQLKELIPQYYGLEDIRDRSGDIVPFMMLEDIASRFHKPCIMDIKVGKRVWDDFAEQSKIDREKKKYPPQEVIGFRIIGMRVYRHDRNDFVHFSKQFGRSVTANGALEALREFFLDGKGLRSDIIDALIGQLHRYREWVETQTTFKLFATSLLIVYEGDDTRPIKTQRDLMDVRLVDFAHAYERNPADNGPDENFLFGLRSFVKFLDNLKR